jgi:hypothetical protein
MALQPVVKRFSLPSVRSSPRRSFGYHPLSDISSADASGNSIVDDDAEHCRNGESKSDFHHEQKEIECESAITNDDYCNENDGFVNSEHVSSADNSKAPLVSRSLVSETGLAPAQSQRHSFSYTPELHNSGKTCCATGTAANGNPDDQALISDDCLEDPSHFHTEDPQRCLLASEHFEDSGAQWLDEDEQKNEGLGFEYQESPSRLLNKRVYVRLIVGDDDEIGMAM